MIRQTQLLTQRLKQVWSVATSLLERSEIGGNAWIFRRQFFNIADFNVCRFDTGPFRARTEEPATASDHAGGVKRTAGNQKLHTLTTAKVRANNDAFARAIDAQHQYLDGITEIIVVKLIVADAMQTHRASGVTMKQSAEPAGRPSANGDSRPPGAICRWLTKVIRTNPHIADSSFRSRRTSSAVTSSVICFS
jgi:hypothetical protein